MQPGMHGVGHCHQPFRSFPMRTKLLDIGRSLWARTGIAGRWRQAILGSLCLTVLAISSHAQAAEPATPAECQALQAKYPQFKGKTLTNAINPHTPGYEALDPNDPSKYVGFDIDLGEAISHCLGFTMAYTPVTFAAL